MDVLVLIDKLDDLVHNAKAVPLTDQVRIDREEIYDILDQMRATIPEEIKQARWIVKERQEMLAEAKREQDRLLQEAREQAVREASPSIECLASRARQPRTARTARRRHRRTSGLSPAGSARSPTGGAAAPRPRSPRGIRRRARGSPPGFPAPRGRACSAGPARAR